MRLITVDHRLDFELFRKDLKCCITDRRYGPLKSAFGERLASAQLHRRREHDLRDLVNRLGYEPEDHNAALPDEEFAPACAQSAERRRH